VKKVTVGCVYFTAIMFLLSAFAKCVDIRSFAVLISYFGIIREPVIVLSLAVLIVTMELVLGLTMIVSRALRPLCLKATLVVLTGFSGILVYGWLFKNLQDCGCFGSFVKMSPLVSLLKNAVLMGIAGAGLYGYSKDAAAMHHALFNYRGKQQLKAVVFAASLFLFVGGLAYSFSKETVQAGEAGVKEKADVVQTSDRKFASFQIQDTTKTVDLGQGTYLVAFLSDSCEHCQAIVSQLNALPQTNPDFPPVVALVLGEADTLKQFRQQFKPNFPLGLLEPLKFFDFIGDAPPSFYIIRDGKEVKHWDKELPV
jgi:hypothetical protein